MSLALSTNFRVYHAIRCLWRRGINRKKATHTKWFTDGLANKLPDRKIPAELRKATEAERI